MELEFTTRTTFDKVGTRPPRPDGTDKVTGRALYGADLAGAGMLVGKVLRSPHAHARILAIDTSTAEALPGVKAVVTRDDFPGIGPDGTVKGEVEENVWDVARNVMARDKALYEGHAVAAVAAISTAVARQALKLIDVTWQVLPHVTDVDEAMKPGAAPGARGHDHGRHGSGARRAVQHRRIHQDRNGRHRSRIRRCRCHRRADI